MADRVRLFIRHIAVPLAAGCTVYLLFGMDTTVGQLLRKLTGWQGYVPAAGSAAALIRGYVPDFCWAYSLTASLMLTGLDFTGAVGTGSLFALTLELFQRLPRIRGTFDPADAAVEAAACLIAGVMMNNHLGRKRK